MRDALSIEKRKRGKVTIAKAGRRGDFILSATLLGLALLLGGGSAFAPLQRMVVEIAGVITLGWFFVRGWRAPRDGAVTVAFIIIAALVALVIVHTVPLPPVIWRAMPGRAVIAGVLDVAGAHDAWHSLSLNPAATLEAGYFLIAPIAMFVATLHLDRDAQLKLVLMIAIAAIISALLVMVQAQGAMNATLYAAPHATKGKGIFANKNHNAAFLVLAIVLVAMLNRSHVWLRQRSMQQAVTGVALALLAVAVPGCLSRAGLALLPIAFIACVPLLGGWGLIRRHWKIAAGALVLLLIAMITIAQSAIVQETLDRFGTSEEGRYVFWPDVLATIRNFLPWGSGIGTFVPVFRMNESLEAVRQTYTNHAHSDYLEIVLEAGVPGLIILAAFIAWFVIVTWSRIRNQIGAPAFAPMLAASTGIFIILAASIVDYPLRTLLLACVFAVLAAIIASPLPFEKRSGSNAPNHDQRGLSGAAQTARR